jgi:adhesin transport system outer membrane protein
MNKIPYWWLSCCLFTTQVFAEPSPAVINPEQLSELPSLDGRVALPTSKAAPGTLTMGDAVNRAVNWHPSIREAVGKLYEQTEEVDVAKSKYYPQVNAGVENGYTHDGDQNGFTPSLVLSLSRCSSPLR